MSNNYHPAHLKDYLEGAVEAAHAGGEVLVRYWGKLKKIEHKTACWDLVTEADAESEEAVIGTLQDRFSDHNFLGEEGGLQGTRENDYLWAVDPLDGTTNYTHMYPMVCVSIGLIYRGAPIVGVVYNPILNELFCAARGLGATLNGEKLRVSENDNLEKSLLATGFAYDRRNNPNNNYKEFCHITDRCQGVRRAGAAALDLCYVAAGRLDGYWEHGIKIWDMAAGVVIVEEAGGRVSDYDNEQLDLESGRIVATNGYIHDVLRNEILSIRKFSKSL